MHWFIRQFSSFLDDLLDFGLLFHEILHGSHSLVLAVVTFVDVMKRNEFIIKILISLRISLTLKLQALHITNVLIPKLMIKVKKCLDVTL